MHKFRSSPKIRAATQILTAIVLILLLVGKVSAEVGADVIIWNGITGHGHTYGTAGNPGGAYFYSTTSDNIYYQEAHAIEWGVTDGLHQLMSKKVYYYYKYSTPTGFVSWWGGSDYVSTKHIFKSSVNTSVVRYTSANGKDSKATCWNGNANATTCPRDAR